MQLGCSECDECKIHLPAQKAEEGQGCAAPQHPPGEMEARPLSQMFPDIRSEPELTLISLLQNTISKFIQKPSVGASEGKRGWWVQELNKLSGKKTQ